MKRSMLGFAVALVAACGGGSGGETASTGTTGATGGSVGAGGGESGGASGSAGAGGSGIAGASGSGTAGASAGGNGTAGGSGGGSGSGTAGGGASGGAGVGGGAAGSAGSSGSAGGGSTACDTQGGSTLPDVSLAIFGDVKCVYTLAEAKAGIAIPWRLTVGASAPKEVSDDFPATCVMPGPSGLYVHATVSGNGQSYCLCDNGLCPPPPTTVPLVQGTFMETFQWNGENWSGPSDTGNPPGPPFPPGKYQVELKASGTYGAASGQMVPFVVDAVFPITLVP